VAIRINTEGPGRLTAAFTASTSPVAPLIQRARTGSGDFPAPVRAGAGPHGWTGSMPVRVLIADDDEVFRALLRRLMGGTVSVVGEAASGTEAVRLACLLLPEVVLLDVDMPLFVETTRQIKTARPEVKVILMTGHDEEAYLGGTGRSGADAFLPKKTVRSELLSAVRAAAFGRAEAALPCRRGA
jgi:CheY-like chemotaxis protein